MSEVIVDLPDNLDGMDVDEALLREALDALAKKKASQQKAKQRRQNMSPEEKLQAAQAAKRRRAGTQLMINFAKKQGYSPSDEEIDAFLSAEEA